MVWPFKNRNSDDELLARDFVSFVFRLGDQTMRDIAKSFETAGKSFPQTDNSSFHLSCAILGASFATLKGGSPMMSRARADKIESWCKQALSSGYGFDHDGVLELVSVIDKYQEAFEHAFQSKANPFAELSGLMLVRSFGPEVVNICVPGTDVLSPVFHMITGDIMTIATTGALRYLRKRAGLEDA